VVTFHGDGAPTSAHLNLLQSLGITQGITFQSLPIAGVLATAAQVDALANNAAVRSVFLNKKLSYFNYNGTHLTGVQRLRLDKEMTSRNKGLPVSGKGIGVMYPVKGLV
jgi:serine protease AprX